MRGNLNNSRRHGVAIIYVIVVLIVMIGFCSFAVDLGRVQTAKTELRRATDAAARAGIATLTFNNGVPDTSTVNSAAITMAGNNKCDGTAVTITASNVSIGVWDTTKSRATAFSTSGTANNSTTYSAVQVVTSQAVPLLFGEILGMGHCTVRATSTAALVSVTNPVTDFVSAHGNPWLAGQPAGSQGSVPDPGYNNPSNNNHAFKYDIANPAKVAAAVAAATSSDSSDPASVYNTPTDSSKVYSTDYQTGEPYGSPVSISVTPGEIIQVNVPLNSSNMAHTDGFLTGGSGNTYANGSNGGTYNEYSDDGANPSMTQGTTTTSGSENGISNIITPIDSMVGVFMDRNGATYGADSTQENETTVPPGLDFSTQAARDYASGTTQGTTAAANEMTGGSIEPQLNQAFYAGNGQTSTGTTETIIVPNNAYAMFLGTMDGHEWSNNTGGFNATITEFNIELVQ